MSGGKARGKQSSECTDKQPDEGSVVTSWDTTAAEYEVKSPGHTLRKSMRLKAMSPVKQAGGKGETEKDKYPAAQKKRTRTKQGSLTTYGSGQDVSVCRCPLEQNLLGRHPQRHDR